VSVVVNPKIATPLHKGVYGITINENQDNESDHEERARLATNQVSG